ncbi:Vps51/Vps67-domain-containing protein [Clohesyomyces aquaticus]|uniref:Vacuolar protein sorting-associated protein 51 homolog n=1 Tax=Clohesyomyces aquaticus TaxID=1231657 RepID=A0A1Y1ZP71_9PLEO|nr:Vps51/Vps67-domain-containing protein [Clohesyomyces aquaticus]
MSTIASPRVSTSVRSPSSTRTSFEGSTRAGAPVNPRRNRAALRDYYGLKANKDAESKISEESTRTDISPDDEETLAELDKEGFEAETFVNNILATQGLSGVLKVEADLVSQIRNLDSDRKSLVYDNYSKLLSATSTIRRMRTNMDPLAPTTHTLSPAISHIAETAASLSSGMQSLQQRPKGLGIDVRVEAADEELDAAKKRRNQRDTVRWVLDTPRRLTSFIENEGTESAEKEWEEVSKILEKWKGVAGVEELRQQCEAVLDEADEDEGESE